MRPSIALCAALALSLAAGLARADSEAESFSTAAERRIKTPPIEAQSAAIAQAMASICNDERGCFGVQGGRERNTRSRSNRLQPATRLPAYQQECAACHMAYPPGLLPARSWQRIMNGLDKHYGSDASLDAASVQQISTWLQANAGTSRRGREEPPQDRITRSAWFEREHREVPAEVWRRPAVGSRAQCAACHSRAEAGDFDEDRIRIPR